MRWSSVADAPHRLRRAPPPRAISPPQRLPFSSSPDPLAAELAAADDLVAALECLPSLSSLLPPLTLLSPRLSPHSLAAAAAAISTPAAAYRLLVWCSRRRQLRSRPTYRAVVSLLRGDPEAAWPVLAEAKAISFPMSSDPFSALIEAYAYSNSAAGAIAAFDRMPEFAAPRNTFLYNNLLKVLIDHKGILVAMAVYNNMIAADHHQCCPNAATYTLLMDALCKAGMTDDASKLFDEMLGRGVPINAMVHTVLLSALCRAEKLDEAAQVLGAMRDKGCEPDSVTCNVMLSGFCKAGLIDEAIKQLLRFEEHGFVLGLRCYSCIVDGLFSARRFEEACHFYRWMVMKNVRPDVVLYTILIRGYAEAGRISEALAFFDEMMDRGLTPDVFCYNTLIKVLCDAGDLERAQSLRQEILDHGLRPDATTFTILLGGLCKQGLLHEAHEVFAEMKSQGCLPTVLTFNMLIAGLCRAKEMDKALNLFCEMLMGRKPYLFLGLSQGANPVRDSVSLQKKIDELCSSGNVSEAYQLLCGIISSGVVPNLVTYTVLINGFCKSGEVDKALKLFRSLPHAPDAITYGVLIRGLSEANRDDEVLMLFRHMLHSGCTPNLTIYKLWMRTLCRQGKVILAIRMWLNCLSRLFENRREAVILAGAQNSLDGGLLEDAIRSILTLDQENSSVNEYTYMLWLVGFCRAERFDDALMLFNLLREFDVGVTAPCCVRLIKGLCRANNLQIATDVMRYAMKRELGLTQAVGNRLLKKLCIGERRHAAQELAWQMHIAGYDMDKYLRESTKKLLYQD